MSFQRYLSDLNELRNSFSQEQEEHEDIRWAGDKRVSEVALNELLEDLTDYSRENGNNALTSKLISLQASDQDEFVYRAERKYSEVLARIIRITRVLETFGREELKQEQAHLPNEEAQPAFPLAARKASHSNSNKVFIVHGHDNSVLFRVKETLTTLGLKPVVLREQANGGRTIIEKFEHYSDVGFAIILMTPDDMGGSIKEIDEGRSNPRARQNVVMELGYFTALQGRERICVLKSEGVEAPSDIFGLVYTPIDQGEAWRMALAKELSEAGYQVDLNTLISG